MSPIPICDAAATDFSWAGESGSMELGVTATGLTNCRTGVDRPCQFCYPDELDEMRRTLYGSVGPAMTLLSSLLGDAMLEWRSSTSSTQMLRK